MKLRDILQNYIFEKFVIHDEFSKIKWIVNIFIPYVKFCPQLVQMWNRLDKWW